MRETQARVAYSKKESVRKTMDIHRVPSIKCCFIYAGVIKCHAAFCMKSCRSLKISENEKPVGQWDKWDKILNPLYSVNCVSQACPKLSQLGTKIARICALLSGPSVIRGFWAPDRVSSKQGNKLPGKVADHIEHNV